MKNAFKKVLLICICAQTVGNIYAQTATTEEVKKFNIASMAINGGEMFAGTSDNGIYHSVDGGLNWVQASTGLPLKRVEYQEVVMSGGNVLTVARDQGNNRRMYLSTDKGANWVPATTVSGVDGFKHNHLTVFNDMVFLGAEKGLFRSVDHGVSWARVPGLDTTDVTVVTSNDKYLVIQFYDRKADGGTFLSADGTKWTHVQDSKKTGIDDIERHAQDLYTKQCASTVNEANGTSYCLRYRMAVLSKNGKKWEDIELECRYFAFDEGNIYAITTKVEEEKRDKFVYERKVLKSEDRGKTWDDVDEKTDSFVVSDPHMQDKIADLESSRQAEINEAILSKQGIIEGRARAAQARAERKGHGGGLQFYGTLPSNSGGPDYRQLSNDRFKERYNHRDSWIDSKGKIHSN